VALQLQLLLAAAVREVLLALETGVLAVQIRFLAQLHLLVAVLALRVGIVGRAL
jgi:hypothetical protein